MNFSKEESKENELIIKAATGNIKMRTIRNLLFSQTVQAVRINNQGALLLGLAKSIYYFVTSHHCLAQILNFCVTVLTVTPDDVCYSIRNVKYKMKMFVTAVCFLFLLRFC